LLNITDDNGKPVCIGAFQPVSFDASFGSGEAPVFDMVLGMAWLRNAYLYVNMGDFIDGSNNTADPYLQLLSVTNDSAQAHRDFVQVRGGGNDTTTAEGSSTKNSFSKKKALGKGLKIIIAIAIGAVLVLVLLATLIWCCCCRNRSKRSAKTSYRPLHAPAPDAAAEMQAAYNPQYAPPGVPYNPQPYAPQHPYDPSHPEGSYQTPYDQRY